MVIAHLIVRRKHLIVEPLADIINSLFEQGIFPSEFLKLAKIMPVLLCIKKFQIGAFLMIC